MSLIEATLNIQDDHLSSQPSTLSMGCQHISAESSSANSVDRQTPYQGYRYLPLNASTTCILDVDIVFFTPWTLAPLPLGFSLLLFRYTSPRALEGVKGASFKPEIKWSSL